MPGGHTETKSVAWQEVAQVYIFFVRQVWVQILSLPTTGCHRGQVTQQLEPRFLTCPMGRITLPCLLTIYSRDSLHDQACSLRMTDVLDFPGTLWLPIQGNHRHFSGLIWDL